METSRSSTSSTASLADGNGDAPQRASSTRTLNLMRRSCDSCGKLKKKCDGGRPCRRCRGAEEECTYSKRRWPAATRSQRQRRRDVHPSHGLLYSTSGAARAQGLSSLKRCRLSASPATGLVGMKENVFLSDFFSCTGFLPLTTRSYIRGTMVKLMTSPAETQRPGAVLFDDAGVAYLGTTAPGEDECVNALRARDPSACIFWCAVALGALAKGSPIESVSRYCQLARHGLSSSSSGSTNAERAMAWAILAYLYLFCGITGVYQEYMVHSESCLQKSIEQGSSEVLPAGFAEIVHHRTTVKSCCTDAETGEVGSFGAQVQAPPELNGAATEADLYTFVMRSYGIFEQAIYRTAESRGETTTCGEDSKSDLFERDREGGHVNPRLTGRAPNTEVLVAMEARLQEFSSQFERLEDVVERPSIRSGIGGIIINGALFLRKAAKGDLHGALDRIRRCVEVFERFPGLCRFTIGAHAAHIRMIALAAIDDYLARELYRRLRTAYNSHRLPGSSLLPPLEEWQGISGCCEDFYCRTMERLILNVFPNTTNAGTRPEDGVNGEGSMPLGRDGLGNGLESTSTDSDEGYLPVASPSSSSNIAEPDLPNLSSNTVELDLPNTHDASPGVSSEIHSSGAELRTRPTLVSSSLLTPNGETQAVLDADLGGDDEGVVEARKKGAGEAARGTGALLVSPGTRECGGMAGGAGIENMLAAEDWLEAAHALLETVSDPWYSAEKSACSY